MGVPEIAYLVGGAVVLLLAVLANHPFFRSKAPRPPTERRAKSVAASSAAIVLVGDPDQIVPSTPGRTAVPPQPFQPPAPDVQRKTELPV
jgi:hypothetical protein